MNPLNAGTSLPSSRWIALFAALWIGLAAVGPASAQDASALKARHAALQDKLANNPFGRPLYLESAQSSDALKGDIFSVVEYPFPMVEQAVKPVEHWCDIMILHLNVKGCKAGGSGAARVLSIAAGRKFDQPIDEAYKLEFSYRVAASSADYLQVLLNAEEGPFGTRNYRIQFQATPIDARRTFIHMSYSYAYGMAARMATQAYLATVGSKKVGFTSTEQQADGKPAYIGGVLGLLERNTMRYYLAIDSYLGTYSAPAGERTEKALTSWYDATERYATQLHEMDRTEYMDMKHGEVRRMREGK
ncbi:MAG: hypothetical protein ABIV63_10630 [Caldimonas sp.]